MKEKYKFGFYFILILSFVFIPFDRVSALSCDASLLKLAKLGQKGEHVRALQDCLTLKGYNIPGGATGYYGTRTRDAVVNFYKAELNVPTWNGLSVGPRGLALLGSTTAIDTGSLNKAGKVGVKRILDSKELKQYFENYGSSYFGRPQPIILDGAVASNIGVSALPSTAEAISKNTPDRFSTTNVQVSGIDEPDIVKTDGTTIYFSREQNYYLYEQMTPVSCPINAECVPPQETSNGVAAITAFPLSSLGLASESIKESGEMLLVKDKKVLIILSYNQVVAYDISNPAKPIKKWTNSLKDNTQIVAARLKGGIVYLVTSTYLSTPNCPIIPMLRGGQPISVPCHDIWAPTVVERADTTYTMLALDPSTGVEKNTLTYLGDSNNTIVAMFENNLYLTTRLSSPTDKVAIDFFSNKIGNLVNTETLAKIHKIISYDISPQSKLTEILSAIESYQKGVTKSEKLKLSTELENRLTLYLENHKRETDQSLVLRISLPDLSIAASGVVPGHLLNQFSLDEYEGNLRLATTVGETWNGNKTVNDVYVLNQKLETIGSVLDMGLTERIYSVRFIGNKGYIVTFRQIDPFYVLDLSIPTRPKMVGELKIPGYSAYLEALSDSLVLGVGREGGDVKLSLFDVSNAKNPIEKSKYILKENWTDVENNHHAFLLDPKHNVFFIPSGKGGYIISYKDGTLSLKAAVSASQTKRALFIEDMLYVVAQNAIIILDENTWKEIKRLDLK